MAPVCPDGHVGAIRTSDCAKFSPPERRPAILRFTVAPNPQNSPNVTSFVTFRTPLGTVSLWGENRLIEATLPQRIWSFSKTLPEIRRCMLVSALDCPWRKPGLPTKVSPSLGFPASTGGEALGWATE